MLFFLPVVFGKENKLINKSECASCSDELDHSRGGFSKIGAIT